MKLGTFVGQQFLEITSDEISYIEQQIKNVVNNTFSNPDKYTIKMVEGNVGVHFDITGFSECEMRDKSGNTYLPKHIKVSVYKEAGFDQAIHGTLHEINRSGTIPPLDITSYSCSVNMFGDWRGYRKKNVEHNVGITKTGYSFGTEIKDLEVYEDLVKVSNYYHYSKVNAGSKMRFQIAK